MYCDLRHFRLITKASDTIAVFLPNNYESNLGITPLIFFKDCTVDEAKDALIKLQKSISANHTSPESYILPLCADKKAGLFSVQRLKVESHKTMHPILWFDETKQRLSKEETIDAIDTINSMRSAIEAAVNDMKKNHPDITQSALR